MSTTRRLAAILADVAGYSRLMAADEVRHAGGAGGGAAGGGRSGPRREPQAVSSTGARCLSEPFNRPVHNDRIGPFAYIRNRLI